MIGTAARESLVRRLIRAAESDPRIVGVLDYGSSSEGRVDEWSDIDVALFIHDKDIEGFTRGWEEWAAQLGTLLLAYVGRIGHPWTVYDADPIPLRVDFDLHAESTIPGAETWPNSPASVEAMLWYDGSGGKLATVVDRMVGKSLAPADPASEFAQLNGDFWYHLLYCYCKLGRGEIWVGRQAFHCEVLEPLLRLLRMEVSAFERWHGSSAAKDIEAVITPERLHQLNGCIPGGSGVGDLQTAMSAACNLGADVCWSIAAQRGWPWPEDLASKLEHVLGRTT